LFDSVYNGLADGLSTTSDNTGTLVSGNTPHWVPLLSGLVVIICSSIVVLTPNGQFLDCVPVAFSERWMS